MRKAVFFIFSALFFITIITVSWYTSRFRHINKSNFTKPNTDSAFIQKLSTKAEKLKDFASNKKYNNNIAFLIDMSVESGKNRLFIMDLNNNKIIDQGLVTHGRCNQTWLSGRQYDNTVGCGCTSLGKYRIGKSYNGRFGLAYKLHGLDATNSNAYKRFVVLHSHECVPENETHPLPLCQSDGCPTVSPVFLKTLSKIIDSSKQAVLLSIYE